MRVPIAKLAEHQATKMNARHSTVAEVRQAIDQYIADLGPKLRALNKTVRALEDFQISSCFDTDGASRSTKTQSWHMKSMVLTMQFVTFWRALAFRSLDMLMESRPPLRLQVVQVAG